MRIELSALKISIEKKRVSYSQKPMKMIVISYRMQLAVDVQIPVECGGLGGEAIYIG